MLKKIRFQPFVAASGILEVKVPVVDDAFLSHEQKI